MTRHLCLTATLCALALAYCAPQPSYADALLDRGNMPADPVNPGRRIPAPVGYVPMGGNHYDFDPDRGRIFAPHIEDKLWLFTPGGWGASTSTLSVLPPVVVTDRCRPPVADVPGPLPIMGLAAAWRGSRRLRRMVNR